MNHIDIKRLFIIDSASLALLGVIIIGIAYQAPMLLNIILQALFISLVIWQICKFVSKRLIPLAIVKTFQLVILLLIDLLLQL